MCRITRSIPLLLILSGPACVRPGLPGLQVEVSPAGEQLEPRKVEAITATFDHPMVAPAEVDKPLTTAPMKIEPHVQGVFRWTTPRVLAFVPARPLARATPYKITIPRRTRALDRFEIDKDVQSTIATERPEAHLRMRATSGAPSPSKWAVADQTAELEMSQPTTPDAVRQACSFTANNEVVNVRVVDSNEPRKRFVLAPVSSLSLNTEWSLVCKPELAGIEGPLGLAKPEEVKFLTYGPLRVVSVEPNHGDIDVDDIEIKITISNPLAKEKGKKLPFTITPAVDGFPERLVEDDGAYRLTVRALEPNTEYTIRVAAPAKDVFGQVLNTPSETRFHTGDAKPRMDVETGSWAVEASRGSFPIWVRNINKVEAEVAALTPERLPALLSQLNWWDDDPVDLKKAGVRSVKKSLAIPKRRNHWQQFALEPARLLGPSAKETGIFYFSLKAPEATTEQHGSTPKKLLVNFTNLGLTSKISADAGLVWVTALDTGRPLADVEVLAVNGKGRTVWQGTTDQDGIVKTPGRTALLRSKADTTPSQDADLEPEHGGSSSDLVLLARSGADWTFLRPNYGGGLSNYNFRLRGAGASAEATRGYLHSDRGLYRPGDTVHLKGLVRVMRPGRGLGMPEDAKAAVVVSDPRGQEVHRQECKLSRYGGFSLDVSMLDDARLGDYNVRASVGGASFSEHFSVEEYRPNTFEVKGKTDAASYRVGQTVEAKVEGRYFYGAPVRGGKVHWNVHSQRRYVSFDSFPSYSFEGEDPDEPTDSYESQTFVSESEDSLDEDGKAGLSIKLGPKDYTNRVNLLVSAVVQDETHQSVARNFVVPVHPTDRYFGIELDGWVYESGKPRAIRAIAVDTSGKQVVTHAQMVLRRVDWRCAWESWGYRGSYRCEKLDRDVETHNLDLGEGAPAEVRFAPPEGGEYEVRLEGKDGHGQPVVARRRFWAWGAGAPAWRMEDNDRFDLIADKDQYKPGDTARLVLRTPVSKDTVGLLTLERDQVLEHRVLDFSAGGQTLDIPLTEASGPNVYASVLLVSGRTGKGPRGLPALRMGLVNLPVRVEHKALQVKVSTDREEYRPGEQVTATIRVTDDTGNPVRTELALAAADEGVLSLIDFKTPDPSAAFYAAWALGTTTATQYERLAKLPEPGQERSATGGDGSGRLGSLRSRFRATAYWSPQVETDDGGKAVVSFQAPDNLTAFRFMAVAADDRDRFGSSDQRFKVNKPLQLLAATPRFSNVGDDFQAGVLVLNETNDSGAVQVEVSGQGIQLGGPERRTVTVPKGGRQPVYFKAKADRAGEAKLRFTAALGSEKDGLEIKFPVIYPAPFETTLLAEGMTDAEREVPLKLPEGVMPSTARLSISVDPDGLAGMEQGLQELVQYPYGCLEQTTSRLIPLVMVEELSKSMGLAELDGPNLQRFIRAGITKIGRHQADEGGFSLWPKGQPDVYLTAFGLWGLRVAADAGHPVDAKRVQDALDYLRRNLGGAPPSGGVHHELGELGGRAFALHVLALYGKPEPGFATKLLEQKANLPRYGLAFLARALAKSLGPKDPAVTAILDELVAAATEKGGKAQVTEPESDRLWYYMSDDVRTSAIVADTLLALRPADPLLPKLVRGLLAERRQGRYGGGWATTQDNLYALVALTHYSKARTGGAPSVDVALGDKALLSADLGKGAMRVQHASIAMSETSLGSKSLTVRPRGGKVHYSVQLRFQRDLKHQKEQKEGLEISREYRDPATDVPISTVKAGQPVRVHVKVHSEQARYHVAVSDYLPAGFEPVQSKFVTTAASSEREDDGESESQWWLDYKEIHDDRVDVFADHLWSGEHSFSYLAKATTSGQFVVPSAIAAEMYQPDVRGTLAPTQFEVRP